MGGCEHCQQETPEGAELHCPLCRNAVYCGEDCRAADWIAHEHECNVHTVAAPNQAVFVPYHYDERVRADPEFDAAREPADTPLRQAHQMRYVSPNGEIRVRSERPLLGANGRYVAPERAPYTITLTMGGKTYKIRGDGEADAIYPENRRNGAARQLAKGNIPMETFVFWPEPRAVYASGARLPADLDEEEIAIGLAAGDREAALKGKFSETFDESPSKSSQLQRAHLRILRAKLHRADDGGLRREPLALDAIRVLRARDLEGNAVALAIHAPTGRLVDVEFAIPAEKSASEDPWRVINWACDAKNLDHVSALRSALEERILKHRALLGTLAELGGAEDEEDLRGELDALERDAATVRAHHEALSKGPIADVGVEVSAAIARSLDTLYTPIEGPFRRRRFRSKLRRFGARPAVDTVRALIERLKKAREARNEARDAVEEARATEGRVKRALKVASAKLKLKLASRRVGAIRDEARDWQRAISWYLASPAVRGTRDARSPEFLPARALEQILRDGLQETGREEEGGTLEIPDM